MTKLIKADIQILLVDMDFFLSLVDMDLRVTDIVDRERRGVETETYKNPTSVSEILEREAGHQRRD